MYLMNEAYPHNLNGSGGWLSPLENEQMTEEHEYDEGGMEDLNPETD